MKIETRKIYIAFDGTPFIYESDCRDYENTHKPQYKMFNRNLSPTQDTNEAVYLYLSEDPGAADAFISQCRKETSEANGIASEDWGWYFWSEYDDSYHFIERENATNILYLMDREGE